MTYILGGWQSDFADNWARKGWEIADLGHPVGATGVRMALDAARQVSGQAGDYQVDGARTCQTLNIGGSTTTTVSLVVSAGD